jgi:hypothetical protein
MAGTIYTLRVVGEFSTKENQVFVPAKDQQEFFNFANDCEAHKGEFTYCYQFDSNVSRKPRGVALWNE